MPRDYFTPSVTAALRSFWRHRSYSAKAPAQFVSLALPAPEVPAVQTEVRLEIKRGAVTVGVAWQQNELGDLAAFVRELLK